MKNDKQWNDSRVVWTALFIAAVAVALSFLAGIYFTKSNTWEEAGQIGDFTAGFLGTGVSLAGMLLFFVALILQTAELRQQREELESNREEMQRSRHIAETQLGLAEETAVVTQVLACTRLLFEAERLHSEEGRTEKETYQAAEQLARLKALLAVLLSRHSIDQHLVGALSELTQMDAHLQPADQHTPDPRLPLLRDQTTTSPSGPGDARNLD